ncbi:EthD family reductase [Thermodesulfobacteriota bacterium]
MIKLIGFFKRRPGMSVEAFQDYWLEIHAESVKKLQGLLKYANSKPLSVLYRRGKPAYDGVAEIWIGDIQSLRFLCGSPDYRAFRTDLQNFTDVSSMGWLVTEEHVIIGNPVPPGSVKLIAFLNRKAGLTLAAFQKYWREIHGPMGSTIPGVRRYLQCHTLTNTPECAQTPMYDGVSMEWYENTAAMNEALKTPAFDRIIADEANFLGPYAFILTSEQVIDL